MDVRKWVKAKAQAKSCVCSDCVADAFTPAITKLVEALESVCDEGCRCASESRLSGWHKPVCPIPIVVAALAELEKP